MCSDLRDFFGMQRCKWILIITVNSWCHVSHTSFTWWRNVDVKESTPFTHEDKHFIKILRKEKMLQYRKLYCEFPNKNLNDRRSKRLTNLLLFDRAKVRKWQTANCTSRRHRRCSWFGAVRRTDISRLSAYVRVNGGYLGHKFWTYDLLLYFVRFINTCFHKLDRYKYAQSANIAWNVLLLCLRLLHGTVATKRMCGRKFLHQVLWHSLAKLWTKNYKIPSISVKITAKKQWHFFYVHTVYMEIIVEIIDESINRCISTVHNLLYKNKSVQLCITRWREICITRSTAATFEN